MSILSGFIDGAAAALVNLFGARRDRHDEQEAIERHQEEVAREWARLRNQPDINRTSQKIEERK